MIRSHFLIVLLLLSIDFFAQRGSSGPVADTSFPQNWDERESLRKEVYEVLAWVHRKDSFGDEAKICLVIFESTDSSGKPQYFFSEYVSNKKPFNKWDHGFIYYANGAIDPASGIRFGYYDLHLELFVEKPSKKTLYALIKRWEFTFYKKDWITLEAGFDSKLWQKFFGFKPDPKFAIK